MTDTSLTADALPRSKPHARARALPVSHRQPELVAGHEAGRAGEPVKRVSERHPEAADLTLRLLEHLAATPEACGVTELATRFGTSKATIHRHLQTLSRHALVRQDASTQRYEPGIRLLQLAESVRDRFGITRAAHDELVRLRDESGQSVTLTTVLDEGVVVLELVPSHSGVEFGIRPGTRMALHCSAHGKVALAFGPERLFERCIAEGTGAHGSGTPLQPERLRRDIAQIRRRGWATAANEVLIGMNALAAPVRDHRGDFAGAIAIVGSTQYIEARPAEAQLQAVQGAARRISGRLGWQGERS